MKSAFQQPKAASRKERWETLFTGGLGLLVALAMAKLGNPAVLESMIPAPANLTELVVQPWPLNWGYAMLVAVLLLSVPIWRWNVTVPRWAALLPATWFCWQLISASSSVDRVLSWATLKQFWACVSCFYLGLFALGRCENLRVFWLGTLGGFLVVLGIGWEQHFGGLERAREYLFGLPDWQSLPPEFIKKVSSDRIYASLFYPNALAGAILLMTPLLLVGLWTLTEALPAAARLVCVGVGSVLAAGALYWSGSKAGWLILLGQATAAFISSLTSPKIKLATGLAILVTGLAGFWWKYHDYFAKGATSTMARLDYWRAAGQTLREKPFLGSGPGTFMVSYRKLKAPESEMARLAHNDFLQQGSDSGLPGMIFYTAWIWGTLAGTCRSSGRRRVSVPWALWLGAAGFCVQSLVEFGLYIPALAWPFFLFLGLLWNQAQKSKAIDKATTAH